MFISLAAFIASCQNLTNGLPVMESTLTPHLMTSTTSEEKQTNMSVNHLTEDQKDMTSRKKRDTVLLKDMKDLATMSFDVIQQVYREYVSST